MSGRLFLIHWHQAEAEQLATPLRDAGWRVAIEAEDGARAARHILSEAPRAVVISLRRLPSHGRETAAWLQSRRSGQEIPLFFVEGTEQKVQAVQAKVPNATFTSMDALPGLLRALRGRA